MQCWKLKKPKTTTSQSEKNRSKGFLLSPNAFLIFPLLHQVINL